MRDRREAFLFAASCAMLIGALPWHPLIAYLAVDSTGGPTRGPERQRKPKGHFSLPPSDFRPAIFFVNSLPSSVSSVFRLCLFLGSPDQMGDQRVPRQSAN